jgi:hypothetical protein
MPLRFVLFFSLQVIFCSVFYFGRTSLFIWTQNFCGHIVVWLSCHCFSPSVDTALSESLYYLHLVTLSIEIASHQCSGTFTHMQQLSNFFSKTAKFVLLHNKIWNRKRFGLILTILILQSLFLSKRPIGAKNGWLAAVVSAV